MNIHKLQSALNAQDGMFGFLDLHCLTLEPAYLKAFDEF